MLLCWFMIASVSFLIFQSTNAVYNRILDLRIANPQIIINYAMFLEEHRYFEESFKVCSFSFLLQCASKSVNSTTD